MCLPYKSRSMTEMADSMGDTDLQYPCGNCCEINSYREIQSCPHHVEQNTGKQWWKYSLPDLVG